MKNFLSKRRFEVLALAIALVCVLIHRAADGTPVLDYSRGGKPSFATKFLRSVQTLESRATDFKFTFRGPLSPHPDVVVVAIDENSAQRFGLWPWPRDLVAKGLLNLNKLGARAIGLDMFFADKVEDKGVLAYQTALGELEKELQTKPELETQLASYKEKLKGASAVSPDSALASAFSEVKVAVQGAYAYEESDGERFGKTVVEEHNELTRPFLITETTLKGGATATLPLDKLEMYTMYAAQSSRPQIAKSASRMGHINTAPDPDGGLRRTPLFVKLTAAQGLLPSIELATAAAYFGATPNATYEKSSGRLTGADIRNADGLTLVHIPLSETEPLAFINHLGPAAVYPTVSFSDVIDGTVDPSKIQGKAALVGVTLVGNYDQRVTPFSNFEPGIFTHAAFLSNILQQNFLTRPGGFLVLELLFMLVAALLVGFFVPRVRFLFKAGIVLGLIVAWLAADQLLFNRGMLLATVMPSLSVFLTGFGVIFLGYLSTDREKGQIRNVFRHYVDSRVMDQMLQHPEKLKLGGDKKDMTVLFSDIRGFTTLAERMTPTALVDFINEYLTPMTDIVFEQQGTLDKYIGDAVMAFWGAPIDQADHALRACHAAMRMLDKLEELKVEWRKRNLPDISIGIGINSGPMTAGNMGSHGRFNYTVMGDAVNLASRLEGTNKEYETNVLISEATWVQVQNEVVARRLGAVRVKGKRKPVRIYELRRMGKAEGQEAEAIKAFAAAVDLYAERKWDEAETLFNMVMEIWPGDAPSKRYLEEIAVFRDNPPGPGWDGVYTATSK